MNNRFYKPDVKIWILECFNMFSNMYFKGWITTREIQEYIKQTYGVFIKKGSIANIIHYDMNGIIKTKIGWTKYYKELGSKFIKNVIKMNPNIRLYRLNNGALRIEKTD